MDDVWIVFAFFTCFETLTDLFISFWFPFYYELKILVVLWLLSPATRGSSILYRKFVHPWLARREEDIDQCIAQARQQGYSTVVQLGTKGVNYATTVLMQTAIKGGGGIMNQLRRSYSQGELVGDDGDMNRNVKALPPHYPQDHYASDYSLDHHHHHNLPPGTSILHHTTNTTPQHTDTTLNNTIPPHTDTTLPSTPQHLHHDSTPPPSLSPLQHTTTTTPTHIPNSLQLIPHNPQTTTLLLSQQQHLHSEPGSLQSYEDDPYSPIRYTFSLSTPPSPTSSATPPPPPQQHLISPQHLTAAQQLLISPQHLTAAQQQQLFISPQHLTAAQQQLLLSASPQHHTTTAAAATATELSQQYTPPLTRHRAKQRNTSTE
ncbi:hypothetical protein Pcinc_035636 [Petrolisthes cinctipes]|uniref:Receptor expression-enhancing protein n=1 Tax=Petrolisthes cinctipes TaxID=88211 RepID=A0AAE1BXB0_PETCI|nr:hypothetical protein Pcinc_035636 [Petrolisthes cinctipes]